jgi:hypothetical protein
MKNIRNINKMIVMLSFAFIFGFLSCSKSNDGNNENKLEKPQLIMYTPVSDVDGMTITFVWNKIQNASYVLEISRDSLLFTKAIQVFTLGDTTKWTVSNLYSNTIFSARLKAVSKDGILSDSDYKTSTLLPIENILTLSAGSVAAADIFSNRIVLKWNKAKNITHITQTVTGVSETIPISESEKLAGNKTLIGLLPATYYTFNICLNDMVRGTVKAKTKP